MRQELLQAVETIVLYCQNIICEKCELRDFCQDGVIASWKAALEWEEIRP